MSGRQFFLDRYRQLGWEFKPVRPKQAIRINCAKHDEAEVVRRLRSKGVHLEKIPFLNSGYWVKRSKFSVGATVEYLLGLYSLQEAAAQIPAAVFSNLKDKSVLDACAAPGGKTVQMADLMRNTGSIIALDVEKQRLKALCNQLERCRVSNSVVYLKDARDAGWLGQKFDRILLDVPCSGNFAGDSKWFSRRTLEDVEKNASLQRELLAESEKLLNIDGEIVYSTCSLEPEEDELNIDWALRNLNLTVEKLDCYGTNGVTDVFGRKLEPSVEDCHRIWPGLTQGFFVCKLKKEKRRSGAFD